MQNRDYFTRPNQGDGRDYYGYGLTELPRKRDPWTKPVLIGAALIAAYFIWQFLR